MSTDTPKYQIMPPLTEEEEAALEKSIAENGVLTPIVVDEHGVIIDGHHRERIATRLGKSCPRRTVRNLTEEQKVAMALTLNVDRRHLTREQKRELLARSIKAEPELSDREHGRRTGTDNKTAAKVRVDLEGREEIPHVEKRTDSAGREQPAKKAAPEPRPKKKPEPQPVVDDDPDVRRRFWDIRNTVHDVHYIQKYVENVADIALCSGSDIDTETPLTAGDLPPILGAKYCYMPTEYNDAEMAVELADKLAATLPRIEELRDSLYERGRHK